MLPTVDPAVYAALDREATRLRLSTKHRATLIKAALFVVVDGLSYERPLTATQAAVEAAALDDVSMSSSADAEMSLEPATNDAHRPAVAKPNASFRGPQSSTNSFASGDEQSQHSFGGISSYRKRSSTSESEQSTKRKSISREKHADTIDARAQSESLSRAQRTSDTLASVPSSLLAHHAVNSAPQPLNEPTTSDAFAGLKAGSLLYKGNNEVRRMVPVGERIVKRTSEAEVRVMEALQKDGQHKNLVRMLDHRTVGLQTEILMELMDMQDLGRLVEEVRLGEEELAYIGREVLLGLSYMHSLNYVHGDVKPRNVLAHSDGSVKLGDFDQSSKVECFKFGGTPGYMAPEVSRRKRLEFVPWGTALDIYSFGRFMAELHRAELQKRRSVRLSLNDAILECSPLMQNFIAQCLKVEQTERPTADELSKHPFLEKAARGFEKFSLAVEELALERKLAPIQKRLQETKMRKLSIDIDEFSLV